MAIYQPSREFFVESILSIKLFKLSINDQVLPNYKIFLVELWNCKDWRLYWFFQFDFVEYWNIYPSSENKCCLLFLWAWLLHFHTCVPNLEESMNKTIICGNFWREVTSFDTKAFFFVYSIVENHRKCIRSGIWLFVMCY